MMVLGILAAVAFVLILVAVGVAISTPMAMLQAIEKWTERNNDRRARKAAERERRGIVPGNASVFRKFVLWIVLPLVLCILLLVAIGMLGSHVE